MSDRPKSRVWAEVAKVVPGPCAGPGSTVVLTYVRTNHVGTLFARSLLVGIPPFLPKPPARGDDVFAWLLDDQLATQHALLAGELVLAGLLRQEFDRDGLACR
jgi:hypothetical protein